MAGDLKPGDQVIMVNCAEARMDKYKGKVFTVRSAPWDLCGSEVVLLEGKSGGFATEFLQKVDTNRMKFQVLRTDGIDNSDKKYLVINVDEPYAGQVAVLIETEERRKGTWEHGNKTMREVMGIEPVELIQDMDHSAKLRAALEEIRAFTGDLTIAAIIEKALDEAPL